MWIGEGKSDCILVMEQKIHEKGSFMKLGVIVPQIEPWVRHAAAWRSLGATHLSVDTMEVG